MFSSSQGKKTANRTDSPATSVSPLTPPQEPTHYSLPPLSPVSSLDMDISLPVNNQRRVSSGRKPLAPVKEERQGEKYSQEVKTARLAANQSRPTFRDTIWAGTSEDRRSSYGSLTRSSGNTTSGEPSQGQTPSRGVRVKSSVDTLWVGPSEDQRSGYRPPTKSSDNTVSGGPSKRQPPSQRAPPTAQPGLASRLTTIPQSPMTPSSYSRTTDSAQPGPPRRRIPNQRDPNYIPEPFHSRPVNPDRGYRGPRFSHILPPGHDAKLAEEQAKADAKAEKKRRSSFSCFRK